MYILILVMLTSTGQIMSKPVAHTATLAICEQAKVLMLEAKPEGMVAGGVCIFVESV